MVALGSSSCSARPPYHDTRKNGKMISPRHTVASTAAAADLDVLAASTNWATSLVSFFTAAACSAHNALSAVHSSGLIAAPAGCASAGAGGACCDCCG